MAITKVKTLGITDANVTAAKLSTDSVETAKITASNVTNAKLGSDISAAKLTAGTISGDRLPAPTLTIKGDGSSADGKLILNCSQNSHGVSIQAPPHSAAQSYNLVLPSTAPGANKILQTDGSGNLSWVDQGSSGKLGQVVQTVITSASSGFVGSQGNWAEATMFQTNITPTATSSKILVFVDMQWGSTAGYSASFKLVRDSTDIYIGDTASNRLRASTGGWQNATASSDKRNIGPYLDSPSTTSQITYKIYVSAENGNTIYLNRSYTDTDASWNRRMASSLTCMEILA